MNEPDPATIDPATMWARTLGDVQHDLRTHAGAAKMWLELITRARDEEERARVLSMMGATLDDFVRLAEDLQDAAQTVAAGREVEAQAFDLAQCLQRAGARMRPKAEFRQIALVLDVDGVDAHVIVGDAEAWERTFQRLLEAALQCCERRERFVVTLRRAETGAEVTLPARGLQLPLEGALPEVWAASRTRPGMTFARGLWLARRHLVEAGGGLALRDGDGGDDGRTLVATLPPATGR